MTHKNAPPVTQEQADFEEIAHKGLEPGHTVGFSRDKDGKYHAQYVREMWAIWQAARKYGAAP